MILLIQPKKELFSEFNQKHVLDKWNPENSFIESKKNFFELKKVLLIQKNVL